MFSETDIDRAARRMIHALGDRAADTAAGMVREQGGIANPKGAMWAKILAGVEDLQWKGYKTNDLDIYRAAKLMIDQHGTKATATAAGSADRLLEEGDVEGAAVLLEVIK